MNYRNCASSFEVTIKSQGEQATHPVMADSLLKGKRFSAHQAQSDIAASLHDGIEQLGH